MFLREDGSALGAEQGFYLKTEGVDSDKQSIIYKGLCSADALLEPRRIQGRDLTVLHAIYHVVEHFSSHVGQIISATKRQTGEDLGFYRYLNGKGADNPR